MMISLDQKAKTKYAFDLQYEKRANKYRQSKLPKALQEIDEEQRMKLPLMSYLGTDAGFRLGLVGLRNIGNTCYLNSII